MPTDVSLEDLWDTTPAAERPFDGAPSCPDPVRRYLTHAIAPGTRLANAVRLRMHGEIKLGQWRSFEAEQVIAGRPAMIWTARMRLFGVPITGYDRYIDGNGEMRWKAMGIIPFMSASGPDISRSAAGRLAGEAMWLPSMLDDPAVSWTVPDPSHIVAQVPFPGRTVTITLALGPSGNIEETVMQRWGNPNGEAFAERPFGGLIEDERTSGGYTIPSRVRVGWYFGTERFEREGEFFRCTIDDATFR